MSPFEQKSALAGLLDRIGLRALLFFLSLLWFDRLWGDVATALTAGSALGLLLCLTLSLWQKKTLRAREDALRVRLGGMLALEEITLASGREACLRAAQCLQSVYPLELQKETPDGVLVLLQGETLLISCKQAHLSARVSCSDVLEAQRKRIALGAGRCVLCATCPFDAQALRLCQTLDPPVRPVDGDTLAALAGHLSPATDEQLVELGRRQRRPFAWAQLRSIVFAPEKIRRYLLYGFFLYLFYIFTGHLYALVPSLLCVCLAVVSRFRQVQFEAL